MKIFFANLNNFKEMLAKYFQIPIILLLLLHLIASSEETDCILKLNCWERSSNFKKIKNCIKYLSEEEFNHLKEELNELKKDHLLSYFSDPTPLKIKNLIESLENGEGWGNEDRVTKIENLKKLYDGTGGLNSLFFARKFCKNINENFPKRENTKATEICEKCHFQANELFEGILDENGKPISLPKVPGLIDTNPRKAQELREIISEKKATKAQGQIKVKMTKKEAEKFLAQIQQGNHKLDEIQKYLKQNGHSIKGENKITSVDEKEEKINIDEIFAGKYLSPTVRRFPGLGVLHIINEEDEEEDHKAASIVKQRQKRGSETKSGKKSERFLDVEEKKKEVKT